MRGKQPSVHHVLEVATGHRREGVPGRGGAHPDLRLPAAKGRMTGHDEIRRRRFLHRSQGLILDDIEPRSGEEPLTESLEDRPFFDDAAAGCVHHERPRAQPREFAFAEEVAGLFIERVMQREHVALREQFIEGPDAGDPDGPYPRRLADRDLERLL